MDFLVGLNLQEVRVPSGGAPEGTLLTSPHGDGGRVPLPGRGYRMGPGASLSLPAPAASVVPHGCIPFTEPSLGGGGRVLSFPAPCNVWGLSVRYEDGYEAFHPCEEGVGRVSYDAGRLGRHASIVSPAPVHTVDARLPWSMANHMGYADRRGAFVPAVLGGDGLAADGGVLSFRGQVAYHARLEGPTLDMNPHRAPNLPRVGPFQYADRVDGALARAFYHMRREEGGLVLTLPPFFPRVFEPCALLYAGDRIELPRPPAPGLRLAWSGHAGLALEGRTVRCLSPGMMYALRLETQDGQAMALYPAVEGCGSMLSDTVGGTYAYVRCRGGDTDLVRFWSGVQYTWPYTWVHGYKSSVLGGGDIWSTYHS